MEFFWRWFLKAKGWNTGLVFPYHYLDKFIMIVAPHTSNWDFIIGLAYRNILGLNNVGFLGKRELFRAPFGWIFHALGGIPVDRQSTHNLVDQVALMFNTRESFKIAIAPEGTRKKVDKLKTGFYFIAAKAHVPVIMVAFDYAHRTVKFREPFYPSGDFEREAEIIYSFYRNVQGRIPANGLMHK